MNIIIHLMHLHPEGTIKTGGSALPFWDAATGAETMIATQPHTWRCACGLLLPHVKHQNHVCTNDPKAVKCPDCLKTKAYADAMLARSGGKVERVAVEMAADAKHAPGEGRPQGSVADAKPCKPCAKT